MLRICCLFTQFLFARPGKLRVSRWRALRREALVRAYEGRPKKSEKGAEA